MPKDCLFCKILAGEIPAQKLHEDESVFAFRDIHPKAPFHALVITKEHLESLNEVKSRHEALVGHAVRVASRLAQEAGYASSGYRLAVNCQEGAGQSVFHLHVHVLGGRPFAWPPG